MQGKISKLPASVSDNCLRRSINYNLIYCHRTLKHAKKLAISRTPKVQAYVSCTGTRLRTERLTQPTIMWNLTSTCACVFLLNSRLVTCSPDVALSAINGEIGSKNSPQVSSHIGKTLHVDAVANRYAVFSYHAESGGNAKCQCRYMWIAMERDWPC